MGGVRADITTFVIRVDSQVKSHQLNEVAVVPESELVRQVESVILVLLHWSNLATLEHVLVDPSGDCGKFGDQIHRVFEGVSPVVLLVHTFGVGLGERGLVLEGCHCKRELCHWVEITWAAVDELFHELGEV